MARFSGLSFLLLAMACSSSSNPAGDSGDVCTGAADPASVMIPAVNCGSACLPSMGPAGETGDESTCYDGCNWCECSCAGPVRCTARACLDAAVDGATPDGSVTDSSTPDAGDASVDSGSSDASADASVACSAGSPCAGGVACQGGPACGDTWTCAPSMPCVDDLVPYCGCDGSSFMASSTCPTEPVAHLGSCEAGANCNRSAVSCRRVEPVCPDGQVPEVQGTCWTDRCIPIGQCACSSAAECPMSDIYTCHVGAGRCGPYV